MSEKTQDNSLWKITGLLSILAMLIIISSSINGAFAAEEKIESKTVAGLITVNIDVETGLLLGSTFKIKPGEKYLFQVIEKDPWIEIQNKSSIENGMFAFEKEDKCAIRNAFIGELEKVTKRGTEIRYESPVPVETGGWCPTGAILLMK